MHYFSINPRIRARTRRQLNSWLNQLTKCIVPRRPKKTKASSNQTLKHKTSENEKQHSTDHHSKSFSMSIAATGILQIVNIPDNSDDDDDDITVLYSTPGPIRNGATKFRAISVENYHFRTKSIIDLTQDSHFLDDEIKLLESAPKTRKRILRGESSNSKSKIENDKIIPYTFMCEICADEKPTRDAFRVLGCYHSYCSECIGKYVGSKLQDNITAINCPVSGCTGFLEPQHCRSILPKQVFDRWGDALCEAVILASEKFYCPFKDCSALLIDENCGEGGGVVRESECPDCNRLFCVQCKVPWHTGIECAEFQKLKEDERSNEDIMLMNLAKSKKWKRCSRCKFYVERSQGCLFMKCRCGYSFCYNCGAPLKDHYCQACKH